MDEIEFRNTSGLTITSIQITYNSRNVDVNPVKAFARIVINNAFVISGLKVVQGKMGYHVSWPSLIDETGKRNTICYPISAVFRDYVADRILQEFKNPSYFNLGKSHG